MMSSRGTAPPPKVLRAFSVEISATGVAVLSAGAWRAGAVVLKRAHAPIAWLEWEERFCRRVVDDGFRLQRLRRASDGRVAVEGWIARDFLVGEHVTGAWEARIGIGMAFLAELRRATPLGPTVPEPRTDAWARADRMAWEEEPIPAVAMADAAVAELVRGRRPVTDAPQVVHGDLTGNMLFHPALPPAIIDFSPYFRPPGYAVAVIAADAVVSRAAGLDVARAVFDLPDGRQCLLRAMLFRHLTSLLLPGNLPTGAAADRYAALRHHVLEGLR